jgi:AcrR family transcriptional regulator
VEPQLRDARRLSSNERRAQLLAVASEHFARTGYEATTMDQVAAAAGVTKPLLYQHFESKHALYEELVTEAAVRLLERLAIAAAPDATPREKVERGFDAYFTMLLGEDASFRLLLASSTDEDIARHLDAVEHSLIAFLDPLIDADLDGDHRRLLAAAVIGAAKAAASDWLETNDVGSDPDAASRLARRCAQLVWGGLRSVGRD